MARTLAQTLSRLTPISPSNLSTTARFINFRQRSGAPEKFSGAGKKELEESEMDMEKVALKNLEDAIHRIVVKRSEPGWLLFAPGSSYWVPPRSRSRGFAEVVDKLTELQTPVSTVKREQALSRAYHRGWPSSAYYFKGELLRLDDCRDMTGKEHLMQGYPNFHWRERQHKKHHNQKKRRGSLCTLKQTGMQASKASTVLRSTEGWKMDECTRDQ